MPKIRWMIRRDFADILQFDPEICEQKLLELNRSGHIVPRVATIGDGIVAGYFLCGLYENRIELVRLIVKDEYRGQGVGRAMVNRAVEGLRYERKKVVAMIPEDRLDLLLFLKHCGFHGKLIKGYYDGLDAIRMIKCRSK